MPPVRILLVEDNLLAQNVMSHHLQEHALDVASSYNEARRKLETNSYDLCFFDLKLGDEDNECSGLKLIALARAKKFYSVVMSGHDSESYVQKAYELGCDDFYAKGNEEHNLSQILSKYYQRKEKERLDERIFFSESFITQDDDTKFSIKEALQFAPSELPILILGPSGSGKTYLARLIHEYSMRSGEFISINCSSYTEDLLEAELFGYKKGAFTGASDSRKGKLLLADGGTLFLDEIGTISLKMQTKLLKAIEEKSFYPLGSEKLEYSRFRIISATLEDIPSLIQRGTLRFDFFQRIHGLTIKLKPLRERKEDILPLIFFFTKQSKRLALNQEAKEDILNYSWPGNVREVKKLVDLLLAEDRGLVDSSTTRKHLSHLSQELPESQFVTEEQLSFALTKGMNQAAQRFMDGLIGRALRVYKNKRTDVIRELNIAPRLLYQSLRRQGLSVKKITRGQKNVGSKNRRVR